MAVKYQDYYQVLGVARDAPQDEIQRAYRKLARQYHPDVNKEAGAEEKFKQVGEAYAVLKDPETRRKYDQLGADWKAGQDFRPPPGWQPGRGGGRARQGGRGAGGGGVRVEGFDPEDLGGFSDFFETIFGGRGGPFGGGMGGGAGGGGGGFRATRGASPRAGQTHEAEVTIPLEDAYRGGTRHISLESEEVGDDGVPQRTTRSYDVRIPPGVTDGSTIRLAGQGGPGAGGGAAGDLLLKIRLAPHPQFRVSGHDLQTILPIAPWEAALGAKAPVPTLEGEVVVTIPPGSQSGQKLRLRGKGLPKRGGAHGDLIAELRITVPKELTAEERELMQRLSEVSAFNPRAGT